MNNLIVIWSNDNAFFMHPIWSMGWVLKRRNGAHASAAFRGIFTSLSLRNTNLSPRLLWSFDMWINYYCILSRIELGFNDKIILSQTLFGFICKLKCITFIIKLNLMIKLWAMFHLWDSIANLIPLSCVSKALNVWRQRGRQVSNVFPQMEWHKFRFSPSFKAKEVSTFIINVLVKRI